MSVDRYCQRLLSAKYRDVDKKWFPRWVRRYAGSLRHDNLGKENDELTVSRDQVVKFLRTLLQREVPAWQRLQAVRAIEAYRNIVLETAQPPLVDIRQTLARLVAHSANGCAHARVGVIDSREPQVIQDMRRELRLQFKEPDTEKVYIRWVKRFMKYCGSTDLQEFAEPQIRGFLTDLAANGNVAPSTHKQAKCALLFLYQQVFARELEFLDVGNPKKSPRLPVVLSCREIARLITEFTGIRRLMFELMYGAGLRHRECRRLRVKDVCFDEGHLVCTERQGKRRPDYRLAQLLPQETCGPDHSQPADAPTRLDGRLRNRLFAIRTGTKIPEGQ